MLARIDAIAMHAVKNVLADQGSLGNMRPPLIMGIWGGKGQGKSFQLELCCKRLGMMTSCLKSRPQQRKLRFIAARIPPAFMHVRIVMYSICKS